ncbi:hypothetical protein DYH09_28940 [bacterium CPR1]|jgi:L-amino acid N-acyltransferase YncA|nr:hypothetical protein [bacterium CPR1]
MRRSTVDWPAILERYDESGLAQKAFCEQSGISLSTFSYWLKKRRDQGGTVQEGVTIEPKFLELEFLPGANRKLDGYQGDLVVELPLGVVLRFRRTSR